MFHTANYTVTCGLIIFMVGSYFWCRHLGKLKDRAYDDVARMDVLLQTRNRLAPDIIQHVDKFMSDQRELLSDAIAMLLEPVPAPLLNDRTGLRRYIVYAEKLGKMMHFLLALAPQYSEYSENIALQHLMDEYFDNELKLGKARKVYNKSVGAVRNGITLYPSNIYARIVNIEELEEYKNSEAHDMRGKEPVASEFDIWALT
jgi:LemA protein